MTKAIDNNLLYDRMPSSNYIKLRILHIEDDKSVGVLVARVLKLSPFDVQLVRVSTLAEGLKLLAAKVWDLVLLDLSLPDSSASETFSSLYDSHPYTPIVVLTAEEDLETRAQVVAQGAQDCIYKMGLTPEVLIRSIRFAVERHRLLIELREIIRELEEFKRQFYTFLLDDYL